MKQGGFSLSVVLFIVFLILKLTETITWSWWWVTAPLWISFIIGLVVLCFVAVIMIVAKL